MLLINSDALLSLKTMENDSVDSIVTDPPYGIGYLGHEWDTSLPSKKIWTECFRVLKPGGYIVATSSSRIYHHLATDLESTGFLTHPMLGWLYGNGFPKATNLSKELDKDDEKIIPDDQFRRYLKSKIKEKGLTANKMNELCGFKGMFSHYLGTSQPQFPSVRTWTKIKEVLDLDDRYDQVIKDAEFRQTSRSLSQQTSKKMFSTLRTRYRSSLPYKEKTELAIKWRGFKYGRQTLKPALEPIYLGQKPPQNRVPSNVKKFGVGAMNIDACRIRGKDGEKLYDDKGRYPCNVLHDGSYEVVTHLERSSKKSSNYFNCLKYDQLDAPTFFYVQKASKTERGDNHHPTVKPIKLMEHLVALVTPSGGICLDPFMGSGTTGVAATLNGFDFIGIEKEREYFDIASYRMQELEQFVS